MKDIEHELRELAAFLNGYSLAIDCTEMRTAASWLLKLSSHGVCGQGYFGCYGRANCSSDHK